MSKKKDTDKVTNELLLEVLKQLQSDNVDMKRSLQYLKQSVLSVRNDVHSLRSDILRQEKALAAVEVDVDRIKTRLDLVDTVE